MGKDTFYIVIFFFISFSAAGQSWLSPWENRQSISITNYNYQVMQDYQTRIEIPHSVGMQSDFSDLRFTNSTGNTQVPYWIEYMEADAFAVVWVKVDSIAPFSASDFYMYYANAEASSASDPEATFIFYDDFDTDDGWNIIGPDASTAIVTFDSTTSTLQKFGGCGYQGAWKSIGDTITNFKLITRDFVPADNESDCTINEYGIESPNFSGINLRRQGMDDGSGSEFGLELRDDQEVSDIVTSDANQPPGNWYRTTLSYAFICHFNLHTMMFTDDMQVVGNVYSETYNKYQFDRFSIRGGHKYHLDYIAVATHMCVWPVVVFDEEVETCPQGAIVSIEDDLCEEGLGMITFRISGGVPPYDITWYNGVDSVGHGILDTIGEMTIDSLAAGDYCFRIIDADGCQN